MRRAGACGSMAGWHEGAREDRFIELDASEGPRQGRISVDGTRQEAFHGWIDESVGTGDWLIVVGRARYTEVCPDDPRRSRGSRPPAGSRRRAGKLKRAHDAVACGRRYGGMLLQLAGDVLAEVVGRPVSDVGADHGQPRWQHLGLGQLSDRWQEQAAGLITGGSEEDHALDHGVTPSRLAVGFLCIAAKAGPSPRGGNGKSRPPAVRRRAARSRPRMS